MSHRLIRLVILSLFGALALFVVGSVAYPPVYLTALAVVKGGSGCSMVEVWEGAQTRMRLARLSESWSPDVRIQSEDAAGFTQWSSPSGPVWFPKGGEGGVVTLMTQQAAGIYDVRGGAVRPGDVVFDCGAHVGLFAMHAIADGASRVIAIEPEPKNVDCIRRNLAREIAAGQVIVVPKGVWDKEDSMSFYEDPKNTASGSFVHDPQAGNYPVKILPLTTMDKIAAEYHLDRVDVIKMDIKGAAPRAIAGAAGIIRRHKPRVIVAFEDGDRPEPIESALRSVTPTYTRRCGMCVIGDGPVLPEVALYY